MTKLSVNINKIATLRNARGGSIPNLVQFAIDVQQLHADGITIHPRPDQRHITTQDVYDLKPHISTEYNIEGYPDERFMKLMQEILPDQATLVPDGPHVLTSNAGWDTVEHFVFLKETIHDLKKLNIRTSLFVDTDLKNIEYAKKAGADRIELYTGPYAEGFEHNRQDAIEPYLKAAVYAKEIGLGINAGHDLNSENLAYFIEKIPFIAEVSIGHHLISDAIYWGIEKTIKRYLDALH